MARDKALATEVIDADNSHSTANALLGTIYRYNGEFEQAIEYGRKAVDAEPNGSDVIATLATTFMYAEYSKESLELIKTAMRLSPKYPSWYLFTLGAAHRQPGNFDEAVTAHQEWHKKNSRSPNPLLALVYTYSLAGKHTEAKKAAQQFLQKRPKFSVNKWRPRAGYADPEVVSRIAQAMIVAGLPE